MNIKRLFLTDFRNISKSEIDVSAKQIILKGENGQGKTNILEAVYILCYGSSFRTKNLKEAVNYSGDHFYLSADFTDIDGFPRCSEITFSDDTKTIKLDGNILRDRKELIYSLPCIVFSHEDIEFVRGEPENRRRFFDQTMSLYDPVFFDEIRRYRQILRQRNAAIKTQKTELLDVYDQKLASCGIPIIKEREKVSRSFSSIIPDIYEAVAHEDRKINISYRPSWNCELEEESICRKLFEQRETDLKMQTTTSGPHRDKFILTDKNGLFTTGASTGQMRLASLVFKSTQAAFYRQKTSKDPIFLIDDVLLELDSEKRARYLNFLGQYSQAFFTFLPDEKYFGQMFDLNNGYSKIYNVKNGAFELQ